MPKNKEKRLPVLQPPPGMFSQAEGGFPTGPAQSPIMMQPMPPGHPLMYPIPPPMMFPQPFPQLPIITYDEYPHVLQQQHSSSLRHRKPKRYGTEAYLHAPSSSSIQPAPPSIAASSSRASLSMIGSSRQGAPSTTSTARHRAPSIASSVTRGPPSSVSTTRRVTPSAVAPISGYAPSIASGSTASRVSMHSSGPPGVIHAPNYPAAWSSNAYQENPHGGHSGIDQLMEMHMRGGLYERRYGWNKHVNHPGFFQPQYREVSELDGNGSAIKRTAEWAKRTTFGR